MSPHLFVLDIGCGHLPKHHSCGSINIDIKKPCQRISNFVQADAFHLPIRSDSVDKIICFQVMEHVENPTLLLKEAKRVLKQNCSAIISVPNSLHWRRIIYALRNREVETGFNEHINAWTPHELCNLVKYAELKVQRVWCGTPAHFAHEKGFRYTLDKWMRKVLPQQVGERQLYVEAKNGI